MKVLVAYQSKTGNTRKVAEAMFGEIADEKELKPIDGVQSIEGYDVAFLGFPIEKMGPSKKATESLKRLCIDGGNVVLFITHAAPEGSPELPGWLDGFRKAASGARIVDMFDCQGELARNVKRIMSIVPNAQLRSWAKRDNSQGQPDEVRLERARVFARDVVKKLRAD